MWILVTEVMTHVWEKVYDDPTLIYSRTSNPYNTLSMFIMANQWL